MLRPFFVFGETIAIAKVQVIDWHGRANALFDQRFYVEAELHKLLPLQHSS
jgi:hypothetical protein